MSEAGLVMVVAAALVMLSIVLNHCYARLALVELALNEGLPPGHERPGRSTPAAGPPAVHDVASLEPGVHIFLSRSCHACQRLLDQLEREGFEVDAALHLRYVDRPRPQASTVAGSLGAQLHDHMGDVATRFGADPLPYAIGRGEHGLTTGQVTPAIQQIAQVARDAGIVVGSIVVGGPERSDS